MSYQCLIECYIDPDYWTQFMSSYQTLKYWWKWNLQMFSGLNDKDMQQVQNSLIFEHYKAILLTLFFGFRNLQAPMLWWWWIYKNLKMNEFKIHFTKINKTVDCSNPTFWTSYHNKMLNFIAVFQKSLLRFIFRVTFAKPVWDILQAESNSCPQDTL